MLLDKAIAVLQNRHSKFAHTVILCIFVDLVEHANSNIRLARKELQGIINDCLHAKVGISRFLVNVVYDELLKAYSRQDRDGLFHQFLRYKYILLDKPCEECLDQALNSFCAGQKISDIILHTVFEDKCCHEPYLLVIWRA